MITTIELRLFSSFDAQSNERHGQESTSHEGRGHAITVVDHLDKHCLESCTAQHVLDFRSLIGPHILMAARIVTVVVAVLKCQPRLGPIIAQQTRCFSQKYCGIRDQFESTSARNEIELEASISVNGRARIASLTLRSGHGTDASRSCTNVWL
jgi:hypothetical protein